MRRIFIAIIPLSFLLISISSWILYIGYSQLTTRLPTELEGKELLISGHIVALPHPISANNMRLLLDVATVKYRTLPHNFTGLVQLHWYKHTQAPQAGEQWQFTVKLKAPHGHLNPGGIDYEQFLFRNNIKATGTIRNAAENLRLSTAKPGILPLRAALRSALRAGLTPGPGTGIIIASVMGDANSISYQQWDILNRAGISHLVAISGANLSLIGALAFLLINSLWRYSATLCRKIPAQQAAAAGGLILVWCYALLAGLSVPTLRALIMWAILQGAMLMRRVLRPVRSFMLVVLWVLITDPLAVLSPGFWLSFGAVAILIYGLGKRLALGNWLRLLIKTQWLATVGLVPILSLWFGQLSIIAPLINLIAVPIFTLLLPLTLIASLIGVLTAWFLPLQIIAWFLDYASNGLAGWVNQPWIIYNFAAAPLWVWVAAVLGTLLVLAPRGLPGRWVGMLLLLPLWLWRPPALALGAFRATVLDVGQGLAVLVQTSKHSLLYDTGPEFPGATALVSTLHTYGINRVDRVIISHADKDHVGGLNGLVQQIAVTDLYSGEPVETMEQIPGISVAQCVAGHVWHWDGIQFAVLHPQPLVPHRANDRSCVLRVQGPGGALLLTGDLETAAEVNLARRLGRELNSQVLIAGHHGSSSSTSQVLLSQVRPQWVLISAGYHNKFGFPRGKTLDRIMQARAKIADTMSGGALEFVFTAAGKLYGPIAYRELHARPWTHRPNPVVMRDITAPPHPEYAE